MRVLRRQEAPREEVNVLELGHGLASFPCALRDINKELPEHVRWTGVDDESHELWRKPAYAEQKAENEAYLNALRRKGRSVTTLKLNAALLHKVFPPSSFNFVIAANFFSDFHVRRELRGIVARRALQVLKPGGILMAVDHPDEGPETSEGIVEAVPGFRRLTRTEAERALENNQALKWFYRARLKHHQEEFLGKRDLLVIPSLTNEKIRLYLKA